MSSPPSGVCSLGTFSGLPWLSFQKSQHTTWLSIFHLKFIFLQITHRDVTHCIFYLLNLYIISSPNCTPAPSISSAINMKYFWINMNIFNKLMNEWMNEFPRILYIYKSLFCHYLLKDSSWILVDLILWSRTEAFFLDWPHYTKWYHCVNWNIVHSYTIWSHHELSP